MENLDPGDGAWWWVIGLQGAIGGVIGALLGGVIAGVATWVAVTKTLEHGRLMTAMEGLSAAVADLQAHSYRSGFTAPSSANDPDWADWFVDLQVRCIRVESLAKSIAPELFKGARRFRHRLDASALRRDESNRFDVDRYEAVGLTMALAALLGRWAEDPEEFERRRPFRWSRVPSKPPPEDPPPALLTPTRPAPKGPPPVM